MHRYSFVNVRTARFLDAVLAGGVDVAEAAAPAELDGGLVHNEWPAVELSEVGAGGGAEP